MKQTFLLNPRFEPFLRGEKLKPNSPGNKHWGCMFAFLLPFLIIGAILFGRLASVAHLQFQLRTGAVSVQGKVNKTWVETVDASDFYYLRYRFSVDSKQYAPSLEITQSFYETLGTGDDLKVLYASENPNISLPAPALGWYDLIFQIVVNVLWNGFTIYLCILYLKDWWTERKCLQNGQLLETTITQIEVSGDEHGQLSLMAKVHFKSPKSGKNLKGKVFVQRERPPESGFPEAPVTGQVLYCSDSEYIFL